ncbi:MAG: hypothetical protein BWX58_01612 [Deltaproteobacteria bacterium ADurb.Bin026]|nr:MAG: hypothetical protein BWX58_01612 [Deltaproteobacteria bacterium ADurb.Bin026]
MLHKNVYATGGLTYVSFCLYCGTGNHILEFLTATFLDKKPVIKVIHIIALWIFIHIDVHFGERGHLCRKLLFYNIGRPLGTVAYLDELTIFIKSIGRRKKVQGIQLIIKRKRGRYICYCCSYGAHHIGQHNLGNKEHEQCLFVGFQFFYTLRHSIGISKSTYNHGWWPECYDGMHNPGRNLFVILCIHCKIHHRRSHGKITCPGYNKFGSLCSPAMSICVFPYEIG